MSNKKFKAFLAVALLGTIGLAACNEKVQAKPTNYDENILTFKDGDDIYHNMTKLVEDAYRDGALASDVLNQVLYQYSVSVFGRYNKVAKPYNLGENEITLKAAVANIRAHESMGAISGADVANKFIKTHKAYWTVNNEGKRIDDDNNVVADDADASQSEYYRVNAKWNTIEKRIAINMYDSISGGSYSERGLFSERKLLVELRADMKKVKDYHDSATVMYTEANKKVITPDVEDYEVFEADGYLHRENYQEAASFDVNSEANSESHETAKVTYVEEEIIPTIYRNLLIEQYLLDESYNTLGRSYARKVNVLRIPASASNTKTAPYLMDYVINNIISVKDKLVTLDTFKSISKAYKGITDEVAADPLAKEITTALKANGGFVDKTSYLLGTDYGEIMASYEKIKDDILTTDTSAESDFTGNYTYDKEVGLEIKKNELMAKDYTDNGWFTKTSGLTDLPDSIKTRLFNIGVANVLDRKDGEATKPVDRFAGTDYVVPANENNLVAMINGSCYLKVASKEGSASSKNDILFNEGGTYYIVQIKEAISASKLAKENSTQRYDTSKKEEIINEVAKIVATGDTYQSLSTQHWLEKASVQYHDTVVYDYFKENYPDLFK